MDGVSARLRGLSIDITDRKRDEDALITSEARYRILADLNPQAIWMGAPDGSLTYANQGLLDYLGFTPADLGGETWLKAFHPDDRAARRRSLGPLRLHRRRLRPRSPHDPRPATAAPAGSGSAPCPCATTTATSSTGSASTSTSTTARPSPRPCSSARKRPSASAPSSRPSTRQRQSASHSSTPSISATSASTPGRPRPSVCQKTRSSAARITEIAPLKGIKDLFEQVAAGHPIKNHILEGELPTRPGERRSWNVSYSPINSSDGKVEAIAAVVLEITNQKKAEAALIQSEKLAAVGRLATSISHEINNPLEAITNLLYLIATTDNLPPDLANYVNTAQSELSRVCQIATQTLRFHRQAVRATHVTPAELVTAVLNLYQGRLSNSSIHVEATYETTSTILCFENDIRQVLNNLIANAIDAMRQSGGRLIVRAHDITDHISRRTGIRITIADTGHGMPPAVRSRVFEPFYTTKDLNGTGLGLWISSGIVNRHQGRLTFRSTEHPIHHGTVFSLFLPTKRFPKPDAKLQARKTLPLSERWRTP